MRLILPMSWGIFSHYLKVNVVRYLNGTAWLSSVRVVECYIYLLNGRNLSCKNQIKLLLEKRTTSRLTRPYFIYVKTAENNLKNHFDVTYKLLQNDHCLWGRLSRSQVIMVQIRWASHALQGWKQRGATV